MDGKLEQPWAQECSRVVAEFNDISIEAFRQEWGDGEEISIAVMQMYPAGDDIHLDVGPRAVFLVENETGFGYKIGSDGRLYYHKCVGHVTRISGKDLFRLQWW